MREPSAKELATFLRVFRSMNQDQPPDPEGQLGRVWDWLNDLSAGGHINSGRQLPLRLPIAPPDGPFARRPPYG